MALATAKERMEQMFGAKENIKKSALLGLNVVRLVVVVVGMILLFSI